MSQRRTMWLDLLPILVFALPSTLAVADGVRSARPQLSCQNGPFFLLLSLCLSSNPLLSSICKHPVLLQKTRVLGYLYNLFFYQFRHARLQRNSKFGLVCSAALFLKPIYLLWLSVQRWHINCQISLLIPKRGK